MYHTSCVIGWSSRRPIHPAPSAIPNGSASTTPSPTSSLPSLFRRRGHATSNLTAQEDVYIFGGYTPSNEPLNDLWLYSLKDNMATLFQCYGDIPSPRAGSSISVSGDVLALWGGSHNEIYDDALYWLDLSMRFFQRVR
jgi:hypothetical protein